jgi:hypothetical protein
MEPKLNASKYELDICDVSKKFGEWYQKTNKTEDTNKLTLLTFKIIAILHNTLLETFIMLLKTVSKGLFRNRSQNCCHTFLDYRQVCKTCAFLMLFRRGNRKKSTHHTPLTWRLQAPGQGSTNADMRYFQTVIHFNGTCANVCHKSAVLPVRLFVKLEITH